MAKHYCGEGIRHYRTLSNMKQETLGQALNMKRQNISDMEQNKRQVDDDLLERIAQEIGADSEAIKQFKSSKKGTIINMHNQHVDVDQYNNCVVQVPLAVLDSLQNSLKLYQDAIHLAHTHIADLTARLSAQEGRGA